MTSSSPVRVPSAVQIPELGPALGRVAMPSGPMSGRPFSLDDVRLELATSIFELAADARSWSSAGDREAAVDALNSAAWLGAWEAAVRGAAVYLTALIDERIAAAALESRMPGRRRKRLFLNDVERRALASRIGAPGITLTGSLEGLEQQGSRMRQSGVLDREALERWRAALMTTARKIESAWMELEDAAHAEWNRWTPLVEAGRSWRRPRWLLWLIAAVVLGVAIYVGLVVGGYIRGPAFLESFSRWWWDWWDRLVEPA